MTTYRLAFLVDGNLEQKFIQRACPGNTVRRINCNGNAVAISAMVRRIATQCRLLGSKYYPIVVIIDREDRDTPSRDLCSEIIDGLREEGIVDELIVGVADRMIENWILADSEIVCEDANFQKTPPATCEGLDGKRVIGDCVRYYHETTVGVELLLKCRASRIRQKSPSFAYLYDKLPKKGCRWLRR